MSLSRLLATAPRTLLAGLLCLFCVVTAGGAQAQTLKPLDVEADPNGVDLLSGEVYTRLPELSVPGAGNLRLQKIQDLVPILGGAINSNPYGPSSASYQVNGGAATRDSFACREENECLSQQNNGSHLTAMPGSAIFEYYQGGTGKLIYFDQQNGTQGPLTAATGVSMHASRIVYPDGETIYFAYQTFTAQNGQVWRRPTTLTSSLGYLMTLEYQSPTYATNGWGELAQATIAATANPAVPLARLTYSGNTITDLAGRQWICTECQNNLSALSTRNGTALRLPTESSNSFETEAQPRTYGSVTHAGWVTRVTTDGVDWNYSYVPGHIPQITISQVNITAPLGFSRTVNIANPGHGFNVRPRVTSIVNSFGQTTSYQYNSDGRVTRITHPEGNAEAVAYDDIGNIVERRQIAKPGSPLADIVETAYYGDYVPFSGGLCFYAYCFKPIWTRDALNRQTDYVWSPVHGGLLTRLEPADANNERRKTIAEYDGAARLYRERTCMANAAGVELTCGTAGEQVRQFTYWNDTRLPLTETVTDGVGSQALTTTHSYDAAGRLLSSDGPLPGTDDTTHYRYDIAGRRTWEIGPLGANGRRSATRTTYRDSDDKPIIVEAGTVANPADTNLVVVTGTDLAYDSYRNPASEAVSSGGTMHALTQRASDARGRVECQTLRMNPAAFASPPGACALGTAGSFGPDRISRTVYDAESRVLQQQRAVGTPLQQNEASYTYSPNGRRTSVTDANGNRAEMRYDRFDRQDRWTFPSTTMPGVVNAADYEQYGYDILGNRTSLRRRDGTTISYQYDPLNRVSLKTVPTSASGAAGYSVHYGYDAGNRQLYARFGAAGGAGITNTYDSLGRLASSSTNMSGTARTLSYAYDSSGRRASLTFPDTYLFGYTYDAAGRLTSILKNNNPFSVEASFAYDSAGRPSARTTGVTNISYGYDPVSQLQSLGHDLAATSADQTLTFSYNPASQITSRTSANVAYASNTAYDVTRPYAVNGLNQYTTAGPATFGYDANGNLTSDGATTFVYDAENRLVSASGARNATLSYDPLGRLWQVTAGVGSTQFLNDGDELVAEYSGTTGAVLRRYAHGLGSDDPVLWYEGSSLSTRRSLHADHQGSIVAVADSAGAAAAINGYDAWGIPNAANAGRFQYTGQAWLPELGLYYYKARIYSPTLGRFLQIDPVGYDDQVNLYAYVANDPTNATDPTGAASDYAASCNSAASRICGVAKDAAVRSERAENRTSNTDPPRNTGRGGDGRPLASTDNRPPPEMLIEPATRPWYSDIRVLRGLGGALGLIFGLSGDTCRVCDISLEGVLARPGTLSGISFDQFYRQIGTPPAGWYWTRNWQGSHRGQGFVLRQWGSRDWTGRYVRWQPGPNRHGQNPYWRVNNGSGDSPEIMSGGRW